MERGQVVGGDHRDELLELRSEVVHLENLRELEQLGQRVERDIRLDLQERATITKVAHAVQISTGDVST